MGWGQMAAAGVLAATVLAGCFVQFAQYRMKGVRSRNASYLLAAGGLFFIFLSLLATEPLRQLLAIMAQPGPRFGFFLAGCLLLVGALVLFLYLTYLRPNRLRFEDELLEELPQHPPGEES